MPLARIVGIRSLADSEKAASWVKGMYDLGIVTPPSNSQVSPSFMGGDRVWYHLKGIPVEFWPRFWRKGKKADEILGFLSNCTPSATALASASAKSDGRDAARFGFADHTGRQLKSADNEF